MDKDRIKIKDVIRKHPLILFDGVCNLCNSSVQLVIKNDTQNLFVFAPLQNEIVVDFLKDQKGDFSKLNTILLVTEHKIYTKSSAALKVAKNLKGWYPILYLFYIIPKPIRDLVYNFIAKNRYKWFGKEESCMIPTPELKNKFL